MNEIKNSYRYEIQDRFGIIDAAPIGEGDFAIDYSREDDGKYFYVKQFQGKILFTGAIFKRLQQIERSEYICTEQIMRVFRQCDAGEILIFDGVFRLTEGEWDVDKCQVSLKFEKSTPDKCLKDNRNEKINLLEKIYPKVIVKTASVGGGVFEYKSCYNHGHIDSSTMFGGYEWCENGNPDDGKWQVYRHNETVYGNNDPNAPANVDGNYSINTEWVREIVELDCTEPAAPDWVVVENNCATTGKKKYAKYATLYGCVYNNTYQNENNYSTDWQCSVVGAGGTNQGSTATIDNGMLLSKVLELFVQKFCGFEVVSDFFQINPENPSNINYVTGDISQVNNLVLFQKSDVKRPNVSGNAWKAEWNFEKLMETLTTLFNVAYSVENGVFRLEHISWFSRNSGLDLTTGEFKKWIAGMRKYTYDVGNIPQQENFQFKEGSKFNNVWNAEINYTSSCAIGSNKDNVKNYVVDEVTTDVELCLNNPSSDSNVVDDKGFVLVATRKYNNEYYIITEPFPLNQSLNNTLSFPLLLRKYGQHNRPVIFGKIGSEEFTFKSAKPIVKGEKFSIPLCCDTIFNPNDTVKTFLGSGVVNNATFNLKDKTLDLELLYDTFGVLTGNEPPIISGGSLFTYEGVPFEFDINATDSDGNVVDVFVFQQAYNGLVEILSTTKGRYTPNAGFTGWDFFYLRAKDDWSETSQTANFSVDVRPSNSAPVAGNYSYDVFHGYNFVPNPNLFSGSSDDHGFTLVTTDVITANGISVHIDSTTGEFSYVPAAGYEGTDSFQYTIEDDSGLQSTGTVTLVVGYKNKPKAVADYYLTKKNTALTLDGTAGKYPVTFNDYTPDGSYGNYTTNSENKATAQGGNVIIGTDGKFTYTPPADFVGEDSFSYVVNNANGSATGNVTVRVLPVIYVKLVESYAGHQTITDYCGQPPRAIHLGSMNKSDFTAYFYSDAAGTVPFDVTGLNFRINLNESTNTTNNGTRSSVWETDILEGTSQKILDDFITYEDIVNCESNEGSMSRSVDLSAGAYNII